MATKASIESAIKAKIGSSSFGFWRIGLTHDPVERKKRWSETERQDTTYWSQWAADSLADAQDIEAYFIISKGVQGGTSVDLSPSRTVYVYVF